MTVSGEYFYGNKISDYGLEHGYVDYATLAKAFNHVYNSEILEKTGQADIGYWEPLSGMEDYYEDSKGNRYSYDEAMSELDSRYSELSELDSRYSELEEAAEDRDEVSEWYESEECTEIEDRRREIEDDIAYLSEEHKVWEDDVMQWYVVDDDGARILQDAGEIVYFNETLDMYLWGVTHWGTSWDYVLTNIPCNTERR